MTASVVIDLLFWLFGAGAVVAGWRVFRADSMVRAAYWLMASFVGVAGVLLLLQAEFLGLVLILMMAGEMTIMAVFMVMFMMNPAGLNPMTMVHQHRAAILAGSLAFGASRRSACSRRSPRRLSCNRKPRPPSWAASCWASRCSSSRRPAWRCSPP